MVKRLFDIFFSLLGIIILLPVFIVISFFIVIDSKGGIFYKQERIGKNAQPFKLYKFRTMYSNSDKKGLLTVGFKDNRITRIGYFLRKYKIDELPQLINVFIGNMSFVGPRPEVEKYVKLYNETQRKVFNVKPGITDWASIKYVHENEILAASNNPEKTYIEEIMPAKLLLNLDYVHKNSFFTDIKIMLLTLKAIIK
ncbi:MAG: sugar transferase [Bacteroidia bacterium]|nr:sugar transferase [Bacteroidia bacterium]MCZ2248866.1 sugar transferase [Bacteroidia bacterium]